MEIIKYELKYCERCGTLKMRRIASASTYCRRCESLLARFTFPRDTGEAKFSAHSLTVEPGMLAGIRPAAGGDGLPGGMQ